MRHAHRPPLRHCCAAGSCTVLTDQEYDQRIAFGLAEKCLDDFLAKYPVEWKTQAPGTAGQRNITAFL